MKQLTIFQAVAGVLLCSAFSALAQVAAPTFSPSGTDFTSSIAIQITSATSGSTIYYTTDGTAPTGSSSSIANGSSITLTNTARVKAFARSGMTDSTVATSSPYYRYELVSSNQHYLYGNWPDPFFDDKMNVLKSGPPHNSGDQHFYFTPNAVIETRGALEGFKVLSNWKFHGNGATLKLSKNIPENPPGYISAHVFGAHDASSSGLVNYVLIEDFDINCNYDELQPRTGLLKLRGIQLIGTHNEVRNCTVRQPVGWFGAINNLSEVFAIDLRSKYSNSWNNVISNCVVMDYRGGANTWVNGIAMSASDGGTLIGTVQDCKVYGNGNGHDYGYNAQGRVSVSFVSNFSTNMNRGFNNDYGQGTNIEWLASVFHIPKNSIGMFINDSTNCFAAFNEFFILGTNTTAVALSGPYGLQSGAEHWTFELNWIEKKGGDHPNCYGFEFGPFRWDSYTPFTPPSNIKFYDNIIQDSIYNKVTTGTDCDFRGNRIIGNNSVVPDDFPD